MAIAKSSDKKPHNFKLIKAKNFLQNIWECKDCDSQTLFSKPYTQAEVNRIMATRFPCLPGVYS